MTRQLQEVAVPVATLENVGSLTTYLGQMATETLPAFVLHDAGPDMAAVAASLGSIFDAACKVDLTKEQIERIEVPASASWKSAESGPHPLDVGLHTDGLPGDVLKYGLHLTTAGEAEVSFFETTQQYSATRRSGLLPTEVRQQILQGEVDDTVLEPVRHKTWLKPGSLVVFRVVGQAPIAHDFRTLVAPRSAESIRIMPGRPEVA